MRVHVTSEDSIMTKLEAVSVATKYKKHAELRKVFRDSGDKCSEKYHEGCMKMALQIFEQFSLSHGFGSPAHALGLLDS